MFFINELHFYNLNSNFDTKADKTQISNPNLLDNPFFNVNSRQQNEIIPKGKNLYFVDRWLAYSNIPTSKMIKTENGLNSPGLRLFQYLNNDVINLFSNKDITLSIMALTSEETAISVYAGNGGTGFSLIKSFRLSNQFEIYTITFKFPKDKNTIMIQGNTNTDYTVKAIKLEIGSISTLHMDTPPDIEQERLKCMLSTADASDTYANKGALTQDLWNSTKTYTVGEYCIWNGSMWKSLVGNSGIEPTEGDTWTATSISAELASIISKIDALSA